MHGRLERLDATFAGPPTRDGAAFRGLTRGQWMALVPVLALAATAFWIAPLQLGRMLYHAAWVGFFAAASWRIALCLASLRPPPRAPEPEVWPRYTVLAALHDEAEVAPTLIEALARIDYPADRLEGFIVLEAHDHATLAAVQAADRPPWLGVIVVPPGGPCTKPRALNHALARSGGELITIYDAEDDPDPLQMREAAARFMADPGLVAVQAPLRIRRRGKAPSRFIDRQFATEYAGLFEVILPGMAALGLPFPLGGTSNHVRAEALKAVGGWDPYNVTEDADLGFRLWRRGGRLGVIARPTYETPPEGIAAWLPQRTRWLKGYLQTLGVHTRRPGELGLRGLFALIATLGVTTLSALLHAPALAWLGASLVVSTMAGVAPLLPLAALVVLFAGAAAAWITCAIGAIRAGGSYDLNDMARAPFYWTLTSLALAHAAVRLVREPHAWDKTPHRADAPEPLPEAVPDAGRQAA